MPLSTPTGGAQLLASSVRRSIVDHLASLPRLGNQGQPTRERGATAAELGEVLGLHTTTVRFHLDQLVAAGLVTSQFVRDGGVGRPAKRYLVADSALPLVADQEAGPYQVLAKLLAQALDPREQAGLTPERAGVQWVRRRLGVAEPADGPGGAAEVATPAATTGEWVAKVGGIVDLLQAWGYSPDLAVSGAHGEVQLTLRDCPFLELAAEHPAVVCGVHRGLLRGALEASGEPQATVGLVPFVDDRTCHALLRRHHTPTTTSGAET